MNGAAERLVESLHRKAVTLHLDSDLPDLYQAQLFLIANNLGNESPDTEYDVTPYENITGTPPKLSHSRRIGQ